MTLNELLKGERLNRHCGCRMENSVLGNALEGVPEEEENDEDKPKDSNVEITENIDGEEIVSELIVLLGLCFC